MAGVGRGWGGGAGARRASRGGRDRPMCRGTRLGLKRSPLTQGREVTFRHMVSAGKVESERTPEWRRASAFRHSNERAFSL